MTQSSRKEIKTSTLLRKLFKTPELENFIKSNGEEMSIPPFHIYITELCRSTMQVPEQIIRQAAIERTYGHQLFNGTRKPSRDKVLQLAFGFGLDVENTQTLLKHAQKSSLYPKIKRDAVILHCLNDHKEILDTQTILQELGLTLLGGEEKLG